MIKNLTALLTVLCLFFAAACIAEEEIQVDVTLDGYTEAGGMLYVTWTDDAYETGGLGMGGIPGQTLGDMLQNNGVLSVEPILEGDVFEGWMEVAINLVVDDDGFEWEEYSLISDQIYTTEELLAMIVPDHRVMYVAKWAGIPAEEYYAPYEEEQIMMPSVTLLSGDGTMMIHSEDEQYEASWKVATIEPAQTFGEALELDTIDVVAAEGKMFAGWMVYEYDAQTMETSETHVEEEGVLCFELFEDYHMVLREYTTCGDLLSTEELKEYSCTGNDHVVVAAWTAADAQ